jgi:hypothetical protein
MPQPSVFRALRPSDKQFTPFQTYKNYSVTNALPDGYDLLHAIHAKRTPAISASSAANDPTNTNGINQHVAWNAIDHRYYRHPYDPAKTAELTDRRKTDKFLFYSASLLSVPYFEMGERIKANSVSIESSGFTLQDDGNGNLRDALIDSGSFADRKKLIAYWSFNNEFRKFQNQTGTLNGSIPFDSRTFTPEFRSTISNVVLENGVATSATSASGMAGNFTKDNYISTRHDNAFNFYPTKDWTISFWIKSNYLDTGGSQQYQSTILSKRYEHELEQYNISSGLITPYVSSSVADDSSEFIISEPQRTKDKKFPIHIEAFFVDSTSRGELGDMTFSIGGENKLVSATIDASSIPYSITGSWHHVTLVHSNNTLQPYLNGTTGSFTTTADTNGIGYTETKTKLLIGAPDTTTRDYGSFNGSLAEIRFYDYACTEAEIASLANAHYISGSLYQTNVAGNVFYRNGHMVVSSPMPKYHDTLQGTFTANYKGTHTVYENMVLCNIPKDTMNVSVNPSAIKQGYDSLRIDGMTTGSLLPYVTEIGLYNDQCELLAVGKLAQPIQKRNDVDMNFIVRWDY